MITTGTGSVGAFFIAYAAVAVALRAFAGLVIGMGVFDGLDGDFTAREESGRTVGTP